MVTSIKRFMDEYGLAASGLGCAVLRALLEACLSLPGAGDLRDNESFEAGVRVLLERLKGNVVEDGVVLRTAESAAVLIAAHAEALGKDHESRVQELQSIASMLARTVAELTADNARSVQTLNAIESQIERASTTEDLRTVRAELTDCLRGIREERIRRERSAETVGNLRSRLSAAESQLAAWQNRSPADTSTPPSTGKASYIAVFLLQRASLIEARFGTAVRHRVLAFVADSLRSSFPNNRLVRWQGPAFLIELERDSSLGAVTAEVRAAIRELRNSYFEVGERSVLIDIAPHWSVIPSSGMETPELFRKVDAFVKKHAAPTEPQQ